MTITYNLYDIVRDIIKSTNPKEYIKKIKNTYQGVAGDCYIQAVEWDPSGNVSSWSIHQYGSATKDKNSTHYNDQSFLFSKHQMKQLRP